MMPDANGREKTISHMAMLYAGSGEEQPQHLTLRGARDRKVPKTADGSSKPWRCSLAANEYTEADEEQQRLAKANGVSQGEDKEACDGR